MVRRPDPPRVPRGALGGERGTAAAHPGVVAAVVNTAAAVAGLAGRPDAVARWNEQDFPAIRAQAKAEGATIYFADQAGIRSGIDPGYHAGTTWAPVGRTRWSRPPAPGTA